jgi:hypothetical protein
MKIARRIALVVDWVLAVALSIATILFVLAHFFKEALAAALPETPFLLHGWGLVIMLLAGAAVLALNVVAAWDVIRVLLGWEYLELPAETGSVNVSVRAVREALEGALRLVDQVSGARVAVAPPTKPGRPVIVRAYVDLNETVIYHSISRSLIDILKARFRDVAGSMPVECQVYWLKIKNDNPRLAAIRQQLPVRDMRPQFPVEEEGQDPT